MRQSVRRKKQNLLKKEAYKRAVKDVKKLLASERAEDARMLLPKLYKMLDKAAKTNVIKKNKASRMKSRLARAVSRKAKSSQALPAVS